MKKTKFATKIIFLSIQGYAHGGIPYPFNIGILAYVVHRLGQDTSPG